MGVLMALAEESCGLKWLTQIMIQSLLQAFTLMQFPIALDAPKGYAVTVDLKTLLLLESNVFFVMI